MGLHKNEKHEAKSKRGRRGSVKNSGRLKAFARPDDEGDATWGTADAKQVLGVIVLINALGGAVTWGLSRDFGAHSLTLMLDNSRETLWFNGGEDLNEKLEGVKDTLKGMHDT